MNANLLWKSALLQLILVAALSIVLAILLPKSFFDSWGWITGPLAWIICAGITGRILNLPVGRTLLGAVLAGIPSLIAVLIGVHWLGVIVAISVFALWCACTPTGQMGTGPRSH